MREISWTDMAPEKKDTMAHLITGLHSRTAGRPLQIDGRTDNTLHISHRQITGVVPVYVIVNSQSDPVRLIQAN